jgi:hypothetical protein
MIPKRQQRAGGVIGRDGEVVGRILAEQRDVNRMRSVSHRKRAAHPGLDFDIARSCTGPGIITAEKLMSSG